MDPIPLIPQVKFESLCSFVKCTNRRCKAEYGHYQMLTKFSLSDEYEQKFITKDCSYKHTNHSYLPYVNTLVNVTRPIMLIRYNPQLYTSKKIKHLVYHTGFIKREENCP